MYGGLVMSFGEMRCQSPFSVFFILTIFASNPAGALKHDRVTKVILVESILQFPLD